MQRPTSSRPPWSDRSRLPQRRPNVPYPVRLLLAAVVLAGLVLWLRGSPPPTYDIRLVQRCLVAQGLDAKRVGPRALAAHGAVVVRLDARDRVAFRSDDAVVRSCLDRVAGRRLRLRH